MHSHTLQNNRKKNHRVSCWIASVALLALAAGCPQPRSAQEAASTGEDLTLPGLNASGDWTYTYKVTNAGTRSEGNHGVLSYKGSEVPAPMHINDFYETPWGPLYWVGKPVVLFGGHGWMRNPVARLPAGRALIDPAIVHSERFMVHVKVVTPEELGTPDRLEKDPKMLEALKPFGLTEVHAQSDWFPVGADPIRLHNTKRWGTLTVCRADTNMTHAPTLEFDGTSNLTLGTSPKPASLDELMAPPESLLKTSKVSLCPQADTLQPIQCTLSPFIGDPLVLYLVCRIQDQGPKPPWKVPGIRYLETQSGGEPNQPQSPSPR